MPPERGANGDVSFSKRLLDKLRKLVEAFELASRNANSSSLRAILPSSLVGETIRFPLNEQRSKILRLDSVAKFPTSATDEQVLWSFAVEIDELRKAGLENSDFRRLVGEGLVAHAAEIPSAVPGAPRRFDYESPAVFSARTCFVLTANGARRLARARVGRRGRPRWDAEAGILTVHSHAIKVFRRRAPHQSAILDEFEAQGWRDRVGSPLSGDSENPPDHQLRQAIYKLNSKIRGIHFSSDDAAQGVRWEFVDDSKKPVKSKRTARVNSRSQTSKRAGAKKPRSD